MKWNKIFNYIFSFTVMVVALYYVFRYVSFKEVLEQLSYVRIWPLLLAVTSGITAVMIRAYRWRLILKDFNTISGVKLISPTFIGSVANLLPARLGEVYRAYILSTKERISFAAALSSIIVERLIDLLYLFILIGSIVFFKGAIPKKDLNVMGQMVNVHLAVISFSKFTMIIVFGILLFIIIVTLRPQNIRNIIIRITKKLSSIEKKILHFFDEMVQGLSLVRDIKSIIYVLGISIIVWVFFYLSYYFACIAFKIPNYITAAYLLLVYVGLFITLFPTPVFLGSFQLGCFVVLHHILNTDENIAAGYGIVLWVVSLIPLISIGISFIIKDNLNFHSIKEGIEDKSD
ncbi:MAG: lysylphosphatidylglycerol synthase transmembrane domain-containing protein [Candidatus Hydrogenedentota bacterium]